MATVIVQSHTNSRLYINGVVKHTGFGRGIDKTVLSPATELVVQDLKVITASGASINAPLDTIKVIHSLAVNAGTVPAIGVINSILGSIAYQDAGVI